MQGATDKFLIGAYLSASAYSLDDKPSRLCFYDEKQKLICHSDLDPSGKRSNHMVPLRARWARLEGSYANGFIGKAI